MERVEEMLKKVTLYLRLAGSVLVTALLMLRRHALSLLHVCNKNRAMSGRVALRCDLG